jgi:hypothetical protein
MHPLHLCCIQPFLQSLAQALPFLLVGLIAMRRIWAEVSEKMHWQNKIGKVK